MKNADFLNEPIFTILGALSRNKQYLREIAEKTGLVPSMVHKTLSTLQQYNLVVAESQKNRKIFSINYESPIAAKAISLWISTKIISAKAFAKLIKMKPKGIYLFGSADSGALTHNSDIDLAIFFEKKTDALKVAQIKKELEKEINREIDLVILTPEKILAMKQNKTELLNQITNKSSVLWGNDLDNA